MRFWRHQLETGIPFNDIQEHVSYDWTFEEELDGVAACSSPEALRDLMRHWYHGEYSGEVIVFEGLLLTDVGDGWTTEPRFEIARMPLARFMEDA